MAGPDEVVVLTRGQKLNAHVKLIHLMENIFTALIRRMGEGNIFSLCVSSHWGGGYPSPPARSQVRTGGRVGAGVTPTPCPGPRSGWGQGRGVGWGRRVPQPPPPPSRSKVRMGGPGMGVPSVQVSSQVMMAGGISNRKSIACT